MSNHFIKSSPLDKLQGNIRPSNSIISFDSILTNSRLLDKLDLSKEDENILFQEITKERDNTYADNKNLRNLKHSNSIQSDSKVLQSNERLSEKKVEQNPNQSYIISLPASQFPSLKFNNSINIPDRSTSQNDAHFYTYTPSKKTNIINNSNITNTSIKNILSNVTFKDKFLQSKVEQHYSNTSRYSYIVEEDTNSIRTIIMKNISEDNSSPIFLRRQNLSTKSNASTNSQFSKASLQLSNPLTNETTTSDLQIITAEPCTTSSSNSSPTNESKRPIIFSKSHKKKNSLSSLKNLFKNNKNKSSPESIKKCSNAKKLNNEHEKISHEPFDPNFPSSSYSNITIFHNNTSSSKLVFSPQPHLYLKSNNLSIYKEDSYQNGQDNHINRPNSCNTEHKINSYDNIQIKRYEGHTNNDSTTKYSKPEYISSPTRNNLSGILSPIHKRTTSTYHNIVPLPQSAPVSPISSIHNLTARKHSSPLTSVQENVYHPRDSYSKDEILISDAINMRKVGNLQASALKLRQACQKGNKTAFLLYGLALRYGYGVEVDYIQSFYYIKLAASIKSWDDQVFNVEINPFQLERALDRSIPSKLEEPLVPALYECGIAYLKGYGVQDIDEHKGLKCLEKAASLGHVDSMCLSGIIWSQDQERNGPTSKLNPPDRKSWRKKDVAKAAAWFRIAARRGANLIGSDWIYKKKYLKAAENRK